MKHTAHPERPAHITCGDLVLSFGRIPLVMGVLNVTPDSFSDGGRFLSADRAIEHALQMIGEGADTVDIGGESTRPGSEGISAGEELDRVMPVIEAVALAARERGVPMSIDTRRAEVAREALDAGCSIVNDVFGASEPDLVTLAGERDVPYIVMHMKGNPKTMQVAPSYDDVVGEVAGFLEERARSLQEAGIGRERIILDPGIGFGKRSGDNLELLNHIDELRALGYPVLIGASRKTFLGKLLDAEPDGRLYGSLAVAARCYDMGAEIVRVHDVRATVELFRTLDAMAHPGDYPTDR